MAVTTTTEPTTTVPTSLVEAHGLAGLLIRTLAALGFVTGYVTACHATYAWGDVADVTVQVDDAEGVAAFLGGLERHDYEADGRARHYYAGTWRGVGLHVSPHG